MQILDFRNLVHICAYYFREVANNSLDRSAQASRNRQMFLMKLATLMQTVLEAGNQSQLSKASHGQSGFSRVDTGAGSQASTQT